jgi:hypothetical protein
VPDDLVVTLDEFVVMPRPNVHWLIPGLLPQPGLTILLGPPFSGKSFMALQLGLAAAQGGQFLDQQLNGQQRVLYLQLDTSELIWRDRLASLRERGVSIDGPIFIPNPNIFKPPISILNPGIRDTLKRMLDMAKPSLVIIDVLRELHQTDENDSTAQKVVFDALMSVFGDCSLVLLHHSKKFFGPIEEIDPINICRGSTYITGRADSVWLLSGKQIRIISRYSGDLTYLLSQEKTGFFKVGQKAPPGPPSKDSIILDAVFDKQPGETFSQLYSRKQSELESKQISRSTFFRSLQALGILKTPGLAPTSSLTQHGLDQAGIGLPGA